MKRILCLLMALILCLGLLAGCAAPGEVLMELDGQKITANMYAFWLSRYKAFFVYSYMNNKENLQMWDTVMGDEGKTVNEIFTGYVLDNARTYAAALALYDEYKLALSAEDKAKVKTDLEELADAAGGKTVMNSELANFGVNYDMLGEIYTIEAKVAQLQEHLFAEGGPGALTDVERDAYYNANYARIKHIFVSTTGKYMYDAEGNFTYDENGDPIMADFTDAELKAQREKAADIVKKLEEGADFEELMTAHTEDTATLIYPNGYYFTQTSTYVDEIIDAAFSMEVGEWDYVQSDLGYHIIKRLELAPKAYASSLDADFFTDFEENVEMEAFTRILAPYVERIEVNEDVAANYSLKTVMANYQY
ncbi:MAG: peptidylprolyl isomerase [Clostridia bacterium]|nr:peptidylprolyl isomerase [Clostridia bacterium]